jgi:hypothetical protein
VLARTHGRDHTNNSDNSVERNDAESFGCGFVPEVERLGVEQGVRVGAALMPEAAVDLQRELARLPTTSSVK